MGDETGGAEVCGVAVIHAPSLCGVRSGVVQNDGADPVGALEVGEQEGAVFCDSLGHGFHFAHFKDLVGHRGTGGGTTIDHRGHDPKTDEKDRKKGNSGQDGHEGSGKGSSEAGLSHTPHCGGLV